MRCGDWKTTSAAPKNAKVLTSVGERHTLATVGKAWHTLNEANKFLLYSLVDPRDGRKFYVGASERGEKRPRTHMHGLARCANPFKARWIRSLPERPGQLPYDVVIEQVFASAEDLWDFSSGQYPEEALIQKLRSEGQPLTNIAIGGPSPMRGRRHTTSAETKAKISASLIGHVHSLETRAKLSAARRRRPPTSAETREKLRVAMKGRVFSDATRARLVEAWKVRRAGLSK